MLGVVYAYERVRLLCLESEHRNGKIIIFLVLFGSNTLNDRIQELTNIRKIFHSTNMEIVLVMKQDDIVDIH